MKTSTGRISPWLNPGPFGHGFLKFKRESIRFPSGQVMELIAEPEQKFLGLDNVSRSSQDKRPIFSRERKSGASKRALPIHRRIWMSRSPPSPSFRCGSRKKAESPYRRCRFSLSLSIHSCHLRPCPSFKRVPIWFLRARARGGLPVIRRASSRAVRKEGPIGPCPDNLPWIARYTPNHTPHPRRDRGSFE